LPELEAGTPVTGHDASTNQLINTFLGMQEGRSELRAGDLLSGFQPSPLVQRTLEEFSRPRSEQRVAREVVKGVVVRLLKELAQTNPHVETAKIAEENTITEIGLDRLAYVALLQKLERTPVEEGRVFPKGVLRNLPIEVVTLGQLVDYVQTEINLRSRSELRVTDAEEATAVTAKPTGIDWSFLNRRAPVKGDIAPKRFAGLVSGVRDVVVLGPMATSRDGALVFAADPKLSGGNPVLVVAASDPEVAARTAGAVREMNAELRSESRFIVVTGETDARRKLDQWARHSRRPAAAWRLRVFESWDSPFLERLRKQFGDVQAVAQRWFDDMAANVGIAKDLFDRIRADIARKLSA